MIFNLADRIGLLLLVCSISQNASALSGDHSIEFDYDDFARKSLLFSLRDKRGSFSSELQVILPEDFSDSFVANKSIFRLEEKYSFDRQIGEYLGEDAKLKDGRMEVVNNKIVYLASSSETYQIEKSPRKRCHRYDFGIIISLIQPIWTTEEMYDDKHPILGKQIYLYEPATQFD